MQTYELLVIGGGPAGITLVKMLGRTRKMGILRPEDHSMIYCAMPYAIEGVMSVEKTLKSDRLVTDAGAELIRDRVIAVDFAHKTVSTEQGQTLGYETLVIATGGTPILPPIEGIALQGVITFKTEQDLRTILSRIESGVKKAVVVGAGAIGIELAQALNDKGLETHLVDMDSHIVPNMLDAEMLEDAEQELVKVGIHLHLQHRVIKLTGDIIVEDVHLDSDQTLHFGSLDECSEKSASTELPGLVIFSVGTRPDIDLLKNSPLQIGKSGIIVNDKMETNIPSVYAVGDCAEFTSAITTTVWPGKLATNAVPMARLLAKNLLGADRRYAGFYNGAATKIGKQFVGSSGLTERVAANSFDIVTGYAELTTAFPIMPSAKPVKLKLIANRKTRKILGGQVVSGEPVTDKVDLITMAIQYQITVDQLVNFSYSAQPYQSFFPADNLFIAAAEQIVQKLETL